MLSTKGERGAVDPGRHGRADGTGGHPNQACACGQRHASDQEETADPAAAEAVAEILARRPALALDLPHAAASQGATAVSPGLAGAWVPEVVPTNAPPLAVDSTADEQPRPLPRRARRKLWEIPPEFHCPVIGTCLEVAELRRIGQRHAARTRESASDFEVHVSFVAAAADRNSLSLATYKALERRFQGIIKRFERARDAAALLELWSDCVARGEIAGALWALMTHPQADARVQSLAFEEVHMLSHQVGAGNRADLKRLADTLAKLAELRRDFDALYARTRRQSEEREALIHDLERVLAEREAALAVSLEREHVRAARIAALETELAANDSAQRIAALESALALADQRRAAAEADAVRARDAATQALTRAGIGEQQLAEKTAESAALERLLAAALADSGTNPCADCPNAGCGCDQAGRDLAGRLILCVGGRRPQVQHLARLVADSNGRFGHHDGGLEDCDRRLEALLAGADAVICATDYISHAAYYRTKRYCKHHAKPHVLVPHSGLAAFALALERVAG